MAETPIGEDIGGDIDPDVGVNIDVFLQSRINASSAISSNALLITGGSDAISRLGAGVGNIAFFETVQEAGTDAIEGFGVDRFDDGFVSIVGESSEVDYGGCEVVCKANSVDGTFEFSEELNKYARVEVDIINPAFKNTGLPHWVTEDTFEWVNAGMPSHLTQVYHSNIANFGIAFQRSNPDYLERYAPPYQARFYAACNKDWYDWFNSTVDFDLVEEIGGTGFSLPYANAVLYVERLGKVLVGGQDNLIAIDVLDLTVSRILVDSRRTVFIKDLYLFDGKVYILDESSLYIWDLSTDAIERDNGLGLPDRLNKVAAMYSQNIVIGAQDGIYARKTTQDSWQKVVETTGPIDAMISPDSIFAVANNEFWYSSEGFTWSKVGTISDKNINQIAKHRSQIIVATDEGAHGDNGSLYSNSISLSLLDILDDPNESSQVVVNAVTSNFSSAVFGLSDGRYIIWSDSFVVYEDSNLPTIHKAIFVGESLWLFGYDLFKIEDETRVRKLATGDPV
jgi:hypothetical protein